MKRLTKDEINQCKLDYINGSSITEIAKKLEVSTPSICHHLDKFPEIKRDTHFVTKRKYTIDEYYFKEIDTEKKAYWLGFLFADGYNHTKKYVVKIALQERDGYILEFLKKEIKYTKPLSFVKKRKDTEQNQLVLTITDKRTSMFLENHGVVQNKSHILKFPQNLRENLIIHFIRGVFDGDGFISNFFKNVRNDSCTFSITGTYDICNNIGKYLYENINTTYSVKSSRNSFALYIGGRLQIAKIHKFLYKDATIFLERKKERFEKWETYTRIPTMTNNPRRKSAAIENGKKYKIPVFQYDLNNNLIAKYDGIRDAANSLNKPKSEAAISKCCKNMYRYKTSGGFIWKYN